MHSFLRAPSTPPAASLRTRLCVKSLPYPGSITTRARARARVGSLHSLRFAAVLFARSKLTKLTHPPRPAICGRLLAEDLPDLV